MYYEMTTKVTRVKDDGTEKEVTERYIADCLTFEEAERKGMETYSADNTEGDVIAVKRSNVREIVNENEEKEHYFKATIVDTFIDDKTEKEKELRYYVLIRANDLGEAYRELSSAVARIVPKNEMKVKMRKIGEALNWVIFNAHEKMLRNKEGEEDKQKELWMFEKKVASLINEGFIHRFDDLMNYLRRQYIDRNNPKVFAV